MTVERLLVTLLVTGGLAWPQQLSTALLGLVTDESGGVIAGAEVSAEQKSAGWRRTSHTDAEGRYQLTELPLGEYTLRCRKEGFRTEIRRGILITMGRQAVVNLTLQVGEITSEIVVEGDAPQVDLRSGALGAVMDGVAIRELPLNGRDFARLALLQPGVAPSRRTSDSGGPGLKLVIHGSRPSQVSFLLDGSDINDANNNTPGSVAGVLLGLDALAEFRVLTNAYSAAYGRSGGGVISIATRSGTNQFHGRLFHFLRNSALDAKNFFDPHAQPIPPFKRNQFGLAADGPLRRNRLFFLANFEGLRERLGVTNRSVVPGAAARQGRFPNRPPAPVQPAVRPYLDLIPLPNDRDFGDGTGELVVQNSQATGENFAAGRVDYRLSDATSLFARYAYDSAAVRVPDGFQLVRSDTESRNQYLTAELSHVLDERTLVTGRWSFNRSRSGSEPVFLRAVDPALSFLPGRPLGQITVTGLFSLGPSRFSPSYSGLDLWQASGDAALHRGPHSIKLGADYRTIRFDTLRPQSPWGFYQFNSLADLLAARPAAVELTLPESVLDRHWRQAMAAAYIQDDIQLHRRLVLNLGLRYERVSLPHESGGLVANLRDPARDPATTVGPPLFENPSNRNFAPRAGLAWDPTGGGKTSIRAGFGLFFDPLWTDFYGNAGNRQPPFYVLGSIRNPIFPDAHALLGSPAFVLGRIDTLQFRPQNPYSMKYNFTVQRELAPDTVFTLSYVGQRGVHLVRLIDANQAIPEILADGRKFFPPNSAVRNPNFTGIRHKVTDANSFYNALAAGLELRLRRGLRLRTHYAYSKNVDDGSLTITQGGDNDMTQDPDDRKAERGLSNYDLRHYFVLHFTHALSGLPGPPRLTSGWEWNGILTAASGNPFSALVGFDRARARFQAGTSPQRPDLAPGRSNNPVLGGPDRYFDPSAFVLPEPGFYGNLGRNTLIGPGLFNLDLALTRRFHPRERVTLEFRAELFNALNHPNFAIPSQRTVYSSSGPVGSAGRITATATSSRQFQLGWRLTF